jgi:hypothetical protein
MLGALPLLAGGCSSTAGTASPGAGTTSTTAGLCADSQIDIGFSPMYSAFAEGHTFQVPAVVDGIKASSITWSASDPSMVDLTPYTDKNGLSGVLVTTRKAGTVDIIATAGTLCGKSNLTISAATADDWMIGSARYNNGVVLQRGMGGGLGGGLRGGDAGAPEVACTNCHGDTATALQFKTVAHTPQQTGGFTDAELMNIFRNGMVPPGGYFDEKIVRQVDWERFHRWPMTDEQAKGIIVYLRSLTPTAQTGTSDFGGRFGRGDGGRPPGGGGGFRREAGAGAGGGDAATSD